MLSSCGKGFNVQISMTYMEGRESLVNQNKIKKKTKRKKIFEN